MSAVEYSIGELARQAGVTRRTIRYYVELGLLPPPGGAGRAATYTLDHLRRLEQIRALQAHRLSLEEIRQDLANPSASPLTDETDAARVMKRATNHMVSGLWVERPAWPSPPPNAASARMRRLFFARGAERGALGATAPQTPRYEADQWLRIRLASDVELHVRRHGTRLDRRLARLVAEARRILSEEDS